MAEITFTVEQLSKIQDITARLARDPAFLKAVENAIEGVAISVDVGEIKSQGTEASKGEKSEVGRLMSFGWSIPVSDDGTVPIAGVLANVVAIVNIGSKE